MMKGGMMYSKGDIVVISFPFSNLMEAKKRPMLILAEKGEDLIGCAITSNPESEGVPILEYKEGSLPLKSKIKYWQINTFLKSLVIKKAARISKETHKELINKINDLIKI